jgi:hypothetical protein
MKAESQINHIGPLEDVTNPNMRLSRRCTTTWEWNCWTTVSKDSIPVSLPVSSWMRSKAPEADSTDGQTGR